MKNDRHQQLADEERRLAEKLYELGRTQVMVFSGQKTGIWKQTPAGRGMYIVSLKRHKNVKT